jgi:hypothetical protein
LSLCWAFRYGYGRSIDRLLDFRRKAEVELSQSTDKADTEGASVRPSDANPDLMEEIYEEGDDMGDGDMGDEAVE